MPFKSTNCLLVSVKLHHHPQVQFRSASSFYTASATKYFDKKLKTLRKLQMKLKKPSATKQLRWVVTNCQFMKVKEMRAIKIEDLFTTKESLSKPYKLFEKLSSYRSACEFRHSHCLDWRLAFKEISLADVQTCEHDDKFMEAKLNSGKKVNWRNESWKQRSGVFIRVGEIDECNIHMLNYIY